MDYKIQTVHNAADDLPLCKEIVELTRPVRKTYPKYGKWLEEKFFPGLKDGSRIIIAAKDETGRLAGTILLKKNGGRKENLLPVCQARLPGTRHCRKTDAREP